MHQFRNDLGPLCTGDAVVTLERQLRRPDDRAYLLLVHCVRVLVFDSGLGNSAERSRFVFAPSIFEDTV